MFYYFVDYFYHNALKIIAHKIDTFMLGVVENQQGMPFNLILTFQLTEDFKKKKKKNYNIDKFNPPNHY